jgi:amino acid transporter
MKRVSILIILVGVAIIIFCLWYFRAAINPADSDPMTVNPSSVRTTEWPIFIGILTAFVGVCFYLIGVSDEKKAKN